MWGKDVLCWVVVTGTLTVGGAKENSYADLAAAWSEWALASRKKERKKQGTTKCRGYSQSTREMGGGGKQRKIPSGDNEVNKVRNHKMNTNHEPY